MMLSGAIIHSLALVGASLLPVARAAVFDVVVGSGGLKYEPEFVNAAVGDQIRFVFTAKNHTATQSSLASPCTPLQGGFDSGYVPIAAEGGSGVVASLNITTLDPIWVYCKQGQHCQNGMVFGVNPGNQMAAFKAAAAAGGAAPPPASATSTLAISAATSATSTATTIATTPRSSAVPLTGTEIKVVVGGTGLVFTPSNITAQPGDKIIFEFRQKNHTVTASSFDAPCAPLAANGWDSGYISVAADVTSEFPTYSITVNDSSPIWAYCAQGNHCGQGMVFSANAVESGVRNFQAFQDLAKQLNGTADDGYGGGGAGSDDAGNAVSYRSTLSSAATPILALALAAYFL